MLLFSAAMFAQNITGEEDKKVEDPLRSVSTSDTKSVQAYYENLFSSKKDRKGLELIPSFDIPKEELLEKIRESAPLAGPIDPASFITGPGDIFDISIWGNLPISYTSIVTPEGSLIIPTIGVIDIKNKTLEEVKATVSEAGKKVYAKNEISTTLLAARVFSVTVGGVVVNPGTFFASAVQRVDQVIYMANLQTDLTINNISSVQSEERQLNQRSDVVKYFRNEELLEKNLEMSLRNIVLIRENDTNTVDLVRYYATGDTKYNPLLRDGDRIYVPNKSLEANFIEISGEVRLEGKYEYSENDYISSVFSICQGPTSAADLENVQIYRTDFSTGEFSKTVIDLGAVMKGTAEDFRLKPGDRIVIRKKYPLEGALDVIVRGEVKYPGLYPIVKDKTGIRQIIEEAGGFTPYASLSEGKVLRMSEPLDAAETNPDFVRLENMRLSTLNERQRYYFNYESAIKRDYVAVNFTELFENGNESYNMTLKDGDVILIPPKQNTIYVYGQVAYDGFYNFAEGRDIGYYINLAGGYSDFADEGEVKIIKAGTKNWIDPDDTVLEPGDAIWIPREMDTVDKNFQYYFDWFADAVGVVAGVATVIYVFISSNK